jgi:membrane associated rhomboid family serine protease/Flp pilus assembly protein TadD
MPNCSSCGKQISGFSFGTQSATQCRDCRKANTPQAAESMVSAAAVSTTRPYVTLTLIALNVLVYVAMSLFGASWSAPSIGSAMRWGADFGPLTFNGEWWRLLTSTFVHFGFFHIALNMWCLWDLGRSLEPLMGGKVFTLMYLACGIAASITSLTWNPWRVSAGASGAIFGVAGAFVSYLYLKKAPMNPLLMKRRLNSLGVFIFYNLIYGAAGARIDNSAHVGGLVAGLILGAVLPPLIRDEPDANYLAATSSTSPIDGTSNRAQNYYNRLIWVALGSFLVLVGSAVHAYYANPSVARYGKAVEYLRSKNTAGAVAELQEAVTLKPNVLFAQELLGECRLDQREPLLAIAPLEEARTLAPKSEQVQTNLALAYLGAGKPQDAIATITQVLNRRKDDNWWGLFILGAAYGEIGNFAAASQNLRASIQVNSNLRAAQNALARMEIEQRQLDEAREQYAEVLRDFPNDPVAKQNSAVLAQDAGLGLKPNNLADVAIPYQNLIMKSADWPLFP